MARAKLTYRWADGDILECEVTATTSYPDALNQAKVEALDMYSKALGVSIATLTGEQPEKKAGE